MPLFLKSQHIPQHHLVLAPETRNEIKSQTFVRITFYQLSRKLFPPFSQRPKTCSHPLISGYATSGFMWEFPPLFWCWRMKWSHLRNLPWSPNVLIEILLSALRFFDAFKEKLAFMLPSCVHYPAFCCISDMIVMRSEEMYQKKGKKSIPCLLAVGMDGITR